MFDMYMYFFIYQSTIHELYLSFMFLLASSIQIKLQVLLFFYIFYFFILPISKV